MNAYHKPNHATLRYATISARRNRRENLIARRRTQPSPPTTSPPFSSLPAFGRNVLAMIWRGLVNIPRQLRRRAELREIARFSDHHLRDIGLERRQAAPSIDTLIEINGHAAEQVRHSTHWR